jgi:hypothetical protein
MRTILAVCLLFFSGFAVAQSKGCKLYDDAPGSSARPRQVIGTATGWSFKKRYDQLSEAEKKSLHSMYESIAEGDEPPYPVDGIEPIFRKMQENLIGLTPGKYLILVRVSASGDAKNVSLLKQPSVDDAKRISYFLVTAKYKPARCAGTPCAMDFPFPMTID